MPESKKISPLLLGAGALVWMALVGAGLWRMQTYEFTAGASGDAGIAWPEESNLRPNRDGFTLVVALHPECPCSEATVEQLGRLLAQNPRLDTRILMEQYPDLANRAEDSTLWHQASRLPGVTLLADVGGQEIGRFAARTSGETRLYDADGRLLFQGGITSSRGHVGDNPGEAAIRSLMRGAPPPTRAPAYPLVTTPVFGCPL